MISDIRKHRSAFFYDLHARYMSFLVDNADEFHSAEAYSKITLHAIYLTNWFSSGCLPICTSGFL
jgi:hypothetical protein